MTPIEYFAEISKIPRGSGNEKGIADYIEGVAKAHGLFVLRDKLNNVYVRKDAANGYTDKEPVLFAAHTDMVCEKLPTSTHNFLTDPIEISEKDGLLYANGTTLGGDDGAGVAIMLSLMTNSALIAPVTEYLFTSSEETGMDGAIGFDYSHIISKQLINLDTGNEAQVCIGCASGYRYDLKIPVERTRKQGKAIKITVGGLVGGHSGEEIDSGKQSAVKLLAELLDMLYGIYPFHISQIICDGKANVIPSQASADIFFYDERDEKTAKSAVAEFSARLRSTLTKEDKKSFRTEFKRIGESDLTLLPDMLTLKSTSAVLSALILSRQGVISYFKDRRFPEASINLGIVNTENECVTLSFLARSANELYDGTIRRNLKRLAHVTNATLTQLSYHRCWEYKQGSALQESYVKAFGDIFHSAPVFYATHSGLECGTFYEKLSELGKAPDIISIGPNMYDIHTPKERLDIASVGRIHRTLEKLLENICETQNDE